MPGFDAGWFDELRAVTRRQVERARDLLREEMPLPLPRLGEMVNLGLAPRSLLQPTLNLISEIRRIQNLGFPDAFVVHIDGQHIYTRDAGYDKRQMNIGFAASPFYPWDMMRIGVGFPMKDPASDAAMDYAIFRDRVRNNPHGFDAVYTHALGGYGEFDESNVWAPLSREIVNDHHGGEWRFFGKRLTLAEDAALLSAIPALAQATVNVFQQINAAPF